MNDKAVEHFVLITEEELTDISEALCARVGDCYRPRLEKYVDGRYMVPPDKWATWVKLGITTGGGP